MIIKIYPQNPNDQAIRNVVRVLNADGVIVYPTDSVYALGCSINSPKAIEKLRKIKGKEDNLTIICPDLSTIADYAKVDNQTFKILKRNLPGPFTFILTASGRMPSKFFEKRNEVGVRVPDNAIAHAILREMGAPMVTTSVRSDDEYVEYMTDPELIHERYKDLVDLVVDGGIGNIRASTIVDCTTETTSILRQGEGILF